MGKEHKDNFIIRYFKQLLLLLVPLNCGGCGKNDVVFCQNCQEDLAKQIHPQYINKEYKLGKVITGGKYEGVLRQVILNWKDHGRDDLDYLIDKIINKILCNLDISYNSSNILIIPAPSSRISKTKRGKDQGVILGKKILNNIKSAHLYPILIQKSIKKQVNYSGLERQINKRDKIRIKTITKVYKNKKYILVDDIITTGATIRECQKALSSVGIVPDLTIALAST
ncbi:MAG: hypothetical protein LBM13_05910 [Candidatus Ancillula sp.]|jgi:ComF family protein|nr:hypothetical protein [Candidatus Ancillula sp.]